MYHKAWVTEPFKPAEVLIAWQMRDKKILKHLEPGGKFKDVTDKLEPDGTVDLKDSPTINVDFGPDGEVDPFVVPPENNNEIQSAKQVCPLCGNEFIIKDINLFFRITDEAWEIIKKAFPKDYEKRISQEVYKRNNPETIKKSIEEKGYFTAFCQPCMSKITWSKQLNLGT